MTHKDIKAIIDAAVEAAIEKTRPALERVPAQASPLLTVPETIAFLNSSRAALYRLEQRGVLIPKRFGRKVLYERATLLSYIAQAGN